MGTATSMFGEAALAYLQGERRLAPLLIRIQPERVVSWGLEPEPEAARRGRQPGEKE